MSDVPGNSGARAVLASAPVLATREAEMPQDRMFDAITLSTEGMPADVALRLIVTTTTTTTTTTTMEWMPLRGG